MIWRPDVQQSKTPMGILPCMGVLPHPMPYIQTPSICHINDGGVRCLKRLDAHHLPRKVWWVKRPRAPYPIPCFQTSSIFSYNQTISIYHINDSVIRCPKRPDAQHLPRLYADGVRRPGLCSPRSMFPQVYILPGLCSPKPCLSCHIMLCHMPRHMPCHVICQGMCPVMWQMSCHIAPKHVCHVIRHFLRHVCNVISYVMSYVMSISYVMHMCYVMSCVI